MNSIISYPVSELTGMNTFRSLAEGVENPVLIRILTSFRNAELAG